jgi:hypothetical protein
MGTFFFVNLLTTYNMAKNQLVLEKSLQCMPVVDGRTKAEILRERVTAAFDSMDTHLSRLTTELVGENAPVATPMRWFDGHILEILNHAASSIEDRLAFMEEQLTKIEENLVK